MYGLDELEKDGRQPRIQAGDVLGVNWIDRRLTGLAGPGYHAIISIGLPFEPEDSQYGESRRTHKDTLCLRH